MQNYLKLTFYQKNAKTSQNYIPNGKQNQYILQVLNIARRSNSS